MINADYGEWEGYESISFDFLGSEAVVVKPRVAPNGRWAYKTEYFGAFPNLELMLLNNGWHIAYNRNSHRWASDEDLAKKVEFIDFVSRELSLSEKCTLIGMSCGGLFAVKLAALAPEKTEGLYLDAPVLNLLSCPCDMGIGKSGLFEEFHKATGLSKSDMLSYREHPIDKMDILLKNELPIVLVAGGGDTIVPYVENGRLLYEYYTKNGGNIKLFMKQGAGHHPHSLENPEPIYRLIKDFIK